MNQTASVNPAERTNPKIPVLTGIGTGMFVLYLVTYAISFDAKSDWYTEAWPAYRLLMHGHVLGFIRNSPAYVGSLIMRAPFALIAHEFGASSRTSYVVTALPCLLAFGLFAGYVATSHPRESDATPAGGARMSLRPIDVFMVTPPVIVCLRLGHPEDILGAVLCALAVLLALRGSARLAGFALGVALINKPWAVVIVPFVFAVMPADRRLSGLITAALTAGIVLIPVTAIRATAAGGAGSALGDQTSGIFLVPQLLWWFGAKSWIAHQAHILLVAVDWVLAGAWWWLRVRGRPEPPSLNNVLMTLALLFFVRAALDPWDNLYYLVPFMLTIMIYEQPPGFPILSWIFTILIVVIVPARGALRGLGLNGHAAVFSAFALLTIAWFARRAFTGNESEDGRVYATVGESGSAG